MINNALTYVVHELNAFMVQKMDAADIPAQSNLVVLDDVAKALLQNSASAIQRNQVFVTLVHVEEESFSRNIQTNQSAGTNENGGRYLHLNLYCLVTIANAVYPTALRHLSLIIRFFAAHSEFMAKKDHSGGPQLDPHIERLTFEPVPQNMEQASQLWSTLGTRYLPSVLYKTRLKFNDDAPH